ncbi:MAG TPA: tetratricopeptide repeat protein [Acidimicrobiales bacterium]|jgi:Flp pilus assembly protein TadD|nr:tetratricopeptide repeat protein [Acidimicrobiales bacterium]
MTDGGASAAAARQRAAVLIDLGRHDEALRVIAGGLAQAPSDPALLRLQAMACREAGRLVDAERAGRASVAAAPNDPVSHWALSTVLESRARHVGGEYRKTLAREAASAALEATRLAPMWPTAHRQLAESLALAGRRDEAWAAAYHATQMDPDSEGPWVTMSVVGLNCAADPIAVELVARRALAINPESYAARNNLGAALMGQGRHREAAPFLRQAAADRPGRATAVDNLAVLGASVIRVLILIAICSLFFTPVGGFTGLLLLAALVLLFRPWTTKKLRRASIRVALLLPRLRLPSTSALIGAVNVIFGVADIRLWRSAHSALLGWILVGLGAVLIAYHPAKLRIGRFRYARRGLERFPTRRGLSRLQTTAGGSRRRVSFRGMYLLIYGGLVICTLVFSSHSSGPTTPSLDPNGVVAAASPELLAVESLLTGQFRMDASRSSALSENAVAAQYGTAAGMLDSYRVEAPGPGGQVLIETVIDFDTAADASAFETLATTRTGRATSMCPGLVSVAGSGGQAYQFERVDEVVAVAQITNDPDAGADISADAAGQSVALGQLPGAPDC